MKKILLLLCLGLLLLTICNASKQKKSKVQKTKNPKQNQLNAGFKKIAYVNVSPSWWGASILEGLGLESDCYNIIILTFWLPKVNDFDMVKLWANIRYYLDTDEYGSTNAEAQKNFLEAMHKKGKQLFISAFGGTSKPRGNPEAIAKELANFINKNPYIDGVDIDYEDNEAVLDGSGIDFIIAFQKALSGYVNNKNLLFTHAPQASYFSRKRYNDKGYYKVEKEIGDYIAWYNVQFYNQGNSYNSYEQLFVKSPKPFVGTSFKEIVEQDGIPLHKLVLGKPATPKDAVDGGYVQPATLGKICKKAKQKLGYQLPGFFIWQYSSDSTCQFSNQFIKNYLQ